MNIWTRFRKDRRGVAAVEFALIAPAMVLLYCGLVELCQAVIAERKANHVASAIGDLVTQAETVSTTPSALPLWSSSAWRGVSRAWATRGSPPCVRVRAHCPRMSAR